MEDLASLRSELIAAAKTAADMNAIEELRISVLGKKGRITQMMKGLGSMDPAQRKDAGAALNTLKNEVAAILEERKSVLAEAAIDAKLMDEKVDVTLPTRPEREGRIHPISQTIDEVVAIFGEMGFVVAEGPDIEDDWHNFTALNIPPEHPARQ